MSVFKRLKALFTGAKNDVIEKNSDDKVLNQKKSDKSADLRPKQTDSNTKNEKTHSSESKTPEVNKVDKTENKVVEDFETPNTEKKVTKTKIDVVGVETPTVSSEDEKSEEKVVGEDNELKDDSKDDSKNKEEKRDTMTLLNENEKLTLKNVDPEFTEIFKDAGIDSVKICFQCGTCTGGCPSGRRTPYRVRQLVRKCLVGLKDEVISDDALWMCTTCYTCQERCPREIKIVEIVKMARNVAAQNGFMAPAHKATGSFVIKTGHGVPINDATMELRKRVGLDELPPTTHSHPEALEEVQKICEITGFDDLIGFNKATGELE
ncbi:CoB--CoM heterodisulfide reductase iron-sulfur subunit C [Candidatus Methanobinarius endosymbioticus]|uniref:CoB--CoM heterodisulfide reductase iron-sulfur subunit C n=1 Tax=Candidatus Methanobinarius endosymbioticus TaxID=2006182 RepID=A0A366MDJ7_9EURY|nr:CoB--CoM heterodisulfide reductase iron-sulfur subunit C [Candidatus Methanobinarius endosymbioticus]